MAQKSITSFFKPKGAEITSPLKQSTTKKSTFKRRVIESSSDEETPINKKNIENKKEKIELEVPSFETKAETLEVKPPVKVDTSINPTKSLDRDGTDYNPAKADYHPIDDAFWNTQKNTPYLALARTFQLIEETRGRLKMIEILSNYFHSIILLNPEDLLPSIYLSINQLAPAYEGFELGVAETTLMKVICNATGRELKHIKSQTHITGDLGLVAEQSRIAQRMMFTPAPLTVKGVFKKLRDIANKSGQNKSGIIQEVFVACRNSEARFFIRSLIGKLRIGIAEQSLLQALAMAVAKATSKETKDVKEILNTSKNLSEAALKKNIDDTVLILKTTYCQCPNYDKIIPSLLEHGVEGLLERCPMEPGIPIKPMLAQPTKGVREVLERLDGLLITCEWKYDGERAQIHFDENGVISIYSRNQENNTSKYPDVISRLPQFKINDDVKSFIIDSEIVAWDVEHKRIMPFQVLSTRKRKNVDLETIKVQVCVYAFDLLYLNGTPLVTETLGERRRLLQKNFQEVSGVWHFATSCDTSDMDEVQQFLEDSIKGNCEGLMIKTLDTEATYEIAKRSRNWLKLKKDYLSGVGDSLDLVVIGGYKGKGKRTGTYGGFLLACYDDENEEYQSICKIGTGFSEEDLQKHASYLQQHIIKSPKSYFRFDNVLEPDEWFEPMQVWEVKCADLSLSPVHKAAIGKIDPEKGISLRFPRFIRIRDDKSAEAATTAQQVADMYSSQDQIKNQINDGATFNEFENDFY